MVTLRMANTPALTTATACSKALTGVGATIAAGNQRWNGIRAALPIPKTNRAYSTPITNGDAVPAKIPPSRNSPVPASCHVQTTATSRNPIEVPNKMPRYVRPPCLASVVPACVTSG